MDPKGKFVEYILEYDTAVDVLEMEMKFARKVLTPQKMHWNCSKIAYLNPNKISFQNMHGMIGKSRPFGWKEWFSKFECF